MSKRLWTETCQVGAKNSTQKSSKTKAKLSQTERFGKFLGEVLSKHKGEKRNISENYKGKRGNWNNFHSI